MTSAALLVMDVQEGIFRRFACLREFGPRGEIRQPWWASDLMREYYCPPVRPLRRAGGGPGPAGGRAHSGRNLQPQIGIAVTRIRRMLHTRARVDAAHELEELDMKVRERELQPGT